MYVKTLIFLTALISLSGNAQAGVISAHWLGDVGCEVGMSVFEADPASPVPSGDQSDKCQNLGALACCDAGLCGAIASPLGASSGGTAWSRESCLVPSDLTLHYRLRFDNDLLPESPTLYGLLKPS